MASNDWKFGHKLEQEDSEGLAHAMEGIVNGTIPMDARNELKFEDINYSYMVNKVLLPKIGFVPLGKKVNFRE